MNRKKTLATLILMLFFGAQINAQVTAKVTFTDNTFTDVLLDPSGEIYFNGDQLVIMESSLTGNTSSWAIDDVKKVTFDGAFNSIVNNQDVNNLSIYPNPAKETITLHGITEQNTLVSIYSMDGAKMAEKCCSEGSSIDVSNLPAGLYFVRIGSQTLKLAKL